MGFICNCFVYLLFAVVKFFQSDHRRHAITGKLISIHYSCCINHLILFEKCVFVKVQYFTINGHETHFYGVCNKDGNLNKCGVKESPN